MNYYIGIFALIFGFAYIYTARNAFKNEIVHLKRKNISYTKKDNPKEFNKYAKRLLWIGIFNCLFGFGWILYKL